MLPWEESFLSEVLVVKHMKEFWKSYAFSIAFLTQRATYPAKCADYVVTCLFASSLKTLTPVLLPAGHTCLTSSSREDALSTPNGWGRGLRTSDFLYRTHKQGTELGFKLVLSSPGAMQAEVPQSCLNSLFPKSPVAAELWHVFA